jgi:predicted dithiol-disulfide oxidoreductase (DUF899 family)
VSIAFPGERADYRAARERLLQREIELRRAMEAVAAARRGLPPGGPVPEDYVFQGAGPEGALTDVRMSELFAPGKDSLVIYSFMYPPGRRRRPSRTGHRQDRRAGAGRGAMPVVRGAARSARPGDRPRRTADQLRRCRKTSADRLLTFGEERGWKHLRLLSSAGNTYNRDYHGEGEAGGQIPMLNVFHRDGDEIRHFWATELMIAPADPGQHPRHVGTLEPVWNLFDLTREGRPSDWDEQLSYG